MQVGRLKIADVVPEDRPWVDYWTSRQALTQAMKKLGMRQRCGPDDCSGAMGDNANTRLSSEAILTLDALVEAAQNLARHHGRPTSKALHPGGAADDHGCRRLAAGASASSVNSSTCRFEQRA